MLRLLGLPEADYNVITKDKNAARIHVSFMGKIFLPEALRERIADTKWTQVVAFRPTGQQLPTPNIWDSIEVAGAMPGVLASMGMQDIGHTSNGSKLQLIMLKLSDGRRSGQGNACLLGEIRSTGCTY